MSKPRCLKIVLRHRQVAHWQLLESPRYLEASVFVIGSRSPQRPGETRHQECWTSVMDPAFCGAVGSWKQNTKLLNHARTFFRIMDAPLANNPVEVLHTICNQTQGVQTTCMCVGYRTSQRFPSQQTSTMHLRKRDYQNACYR